MSGKTLMLIQLVSERDQGVASFKEAILSEAFNPASQSSPARSLERLLAGIPLGPEALIELEHQGYVQKVPYKATTVTKLA
jgi:DNA-binding GntR family transcriptional regulator